MSALGVWAVAFASLVILAGLIGRSINPFPSSSGKRTIGPWLGILIDERGRYSLTHFQVVIWALIFISLFVAIFIARLFGDPLHPELALQFTIPPEILGLAGISGGSAILSTAIKSQKDQNQTQAAGVQPTRGAPKFSQMFLVEEGQNADNVIDVSKFQSFFLTLVAAGAYIAMAAVRLGREAVPAGFPGFDSDLLWLIGISHASYIGAKFPTKQ